MRVAMSLSLDFDSKNTLKVTYLHRVELVYHSASVRFLKSILGVRGNIALLQTSSLTILRFSLSAKDTSCRRVSPARPARMVTSLLT